VTSTPTVDLADRFRRHAEMSDRMGAPLYAALTRAMADDWAAGGVVRTICAGWDEATESDLVSLRFLGSLHRLVLTGRAPSLVAYYRNLGGTRAPDDVWPVARSVIEAFADDIRADLAVVPQTNEVGRSVALLVALFRAAAQTGLTRIRLLEVGASAGLNLLIDRYRFEGPGWSWGPAESPVCFDVDATVEARPIEIVARRGCDLEPVDPTTPAGRLRLKSFVWPDNVERYRRLEGALDVAARWPVRVDRSEVSPWLRERLAESVDDDVLTVVWHSVVWQYLDPVARRESESVIAAAAERMPLAHASMEPADLSRAADIVLTLTTYDAGQASTTELGRPHPHGLPLRLSSGAAS